MAQTTKGILVKYYSHMKTPEDKSKAPYEAFEFIFKVPTGVAEVSMQNTEYILSFLKSVGYNSDEEEFRSDLEEFAQDKIDSGEEITLYIVNRDDFIGFSMTQGFKENNKVEDMEKNVVITEVDENPSGITLTLSDGTVGKRSFSRKIDKEWFPDVQKKMRYIKKEIGENPLTYDLNNLVGREIDYVWVTTPDGENEYFTIKKIHPATTPPSIAKSDLIDQLNGEVGNADILKALINGTSNTINETVATSIDIADKDLPF